MRGVKCQKRLRGKKLKCPKKETKSKHPLSFPVMRKAEIFIHQWDRGSCLFALHFGGSIEEAAEDPRYREWDIFFF